jgi:hypothetical protein
LPRGWPAATRWSGSPSGSIPSLRRRSAARSSPAGSAAWPGRSSGVLFLALLGNGLNLLNISTYYQMIIKGALLILAVSAHRRSQPGL